MRMRVAGSHHGATILENLDVVDVRASAQLLKLACPGAHTSAMSEGSMVDSVRSWRGEKHMTRHVPGSPAATRSPFPSTSRRSGMVSGFRAAKSLSKTKVLL